METYQCFERLRDSIRTHEMVPISLRSHGIEAMEWFRTQSLCDLDRRANARDINQRWLEIEREFRVTQVFDQFKKANFDSYMKIQLFVGVVRPPSPIARPPKKPEQQKTWEAESMIKHWASQAARAPTATPTMSEIEKFALAIGLRYLEAQAKIPNRGQRDRDGMLFAWRGIQPLLKKHGFMKEFENDEIAKHKLKFFLTGQF